MGKFKSYVPVIISILISFIIILIIGISSSIKNPREVYKVYIDGEFIGAIKSKNALENYIDKEQKNLKEEYGVKKVYIPSGIDIKKDITFDGNIVSEKEIYKKIKALKNFNIKGYVVTIGDDEKTEKKLYTLKKDLFDKAVKKVLNSFVSEEEVNNYKNDTQPEIKTTGSIIENIYISQDVNIKESYISTDETIFTSEQDLVKYLLFGTLDSGEEYTVKLGDTIETVAFNNKLSTNEFLIVNPEFTSSKNLLSVGQKVNISLISPILDIVVEKNVVEDLDKPYETIEKDDDTLEIGTNEVETEGVNGTQRVTEKIKYINGSPEPALIANVEVLKEPINEVVRKGTKVTYSGGSSNIYTGNIDPAISSGSWAWPTLTPYVITTYYEYRWGSFHDAIDISGCGFGSPIFAIENGTVLETVSGCPNYGYLNDMCGDSYGNHIWIQHPNGVYAIYAHLTYDLAVAPGQQVSKGQVIGYMGSSGSSTGTHLHFGVFIGGTKYGTYGGGYSVNPFSLY